MCLAALSVEDIEDIFLFGNMITGFLLIGLGPALFYRKIDETVTAVKSPLRLPDMIDGLGRAVAAQTVALTITSWRSSRLCRGSWIESERPDGQRVEVEIGMRLLDQTTPILSAFGPVTSTGLGQGRCWNNNSPEAARLLLHPLPPLPQIPVDCYICLGHNQGCLHGNTICELRI